MKKTLGHVGGALLIGLSTTSAQAAEKLFAMHELSAGYQFTQLDATTATAHLAVFKDKEGKCGEAKCGDGKCGGKK